MGTEQTSRQSTTKGRLVTARLGLALVSLVGLAALVWLGEVLLRRGGPTWTAAVSAAATVGLLGVTAIYVWLTQRLVRTQQDHLDLLREQRRYDTVASVAQLLDVEAALVLDRAPDVVRPQKKLQPGDDPNPYVHRANEMARELERIGYQVMSQAPALPGELRIPGFKAGVALVRFGRSLESICRAIRMAARAETAEPYGWGEVGTHYRDMEDAIDLWPWDDVQSGDVLLFVDEEVNRAANLLSAFLMWDPPADVESTEADADNA